MTQPLHEARTERTIILRGPAELSEWALRAVLENAEQMGRQPVGNGWGIRNRTLKVSGFLRRTKSGFSINFYREAAPEANPLRDQLAASLELLKRAAE